MLKLSGKFSTKEGNKCNFLFRRALENFFFQFLSTSFSVPLFLPALCCYKALEWEMISCFSVSYNNVVLSFLFFWWFDRDTREMLIVTSILTESVSKWSKDPANPFHHPYRLSSWVASFADERTCVHMHNLTTSSKSLFRHQLNDCWCICAAKGAVSRKI